MSAAVDICARRIVESNSEGFRADAYDDATGRTVIAQGVVTIGYGCACRQWSPAFSLQVLTLQLDEVDEQLLEHPWYVSCDDMRRSALCEVGFNQGVAGLVSGYPKLIAAVEARDWPAAQAQCTVKTPHLQERYASLAKIMLTGVSA
jgi:GH24 family phage-related lysozyme (muramidase)